VSKHWRHLLVIICIDNGALIEQYCSVINNVRLSSCFVYNKSKRHLVWIWSESNTPPILLCDSSDSHMTCCPYLPQTATAYHVDVTDRAHTSHATLSHLAHPANVNSCPPASSMAFYIITDLSRWYALSYLIVVRCYTCNLHCGSKNLTPTRFWNNINKYWSVSIIFGRRNLKSLQCSHVYQLRLIHQKQFHTVWQKPDPCINAIRY